MGSITVSIVSHGHGTMLPGLLNDLLACPEVESILLTRNIPDAYEATTYPRRVVLIENSYPKGFSANHNAAFRHSQSPFFAVLNPDIRLDGNPFPELLASMEDVRVALSAPAVINPAGGLEDSAREFPSMRDLVRKSLGRYEGRLRYALGDVPRTAPWVAGMFMLVRSADFASLGGFDEGYFLYYEDVDLCARLWKTGRRVMLCPAVHVVHDARRASRRNLRHMRWHASSMARYFRKHALRPLIPLS